MKQVRRFGAHWGFWLFMSWLIAGPARGEILYTDLRPDLTVNQNFGYFKLDLNQDGVNDYVMWLFAPLNPQQMAVTTGDNAIIGTVRAGMATPQLMKMGDLIDAGAEWVQAEDRFSPTAAQAVKDLHSGKRQAFYGLKLSLTSGEHFGWVQVYLDSDNESFTIMDFAVESVPGVSIKAGDKGNSPLIADPALDLSVRALEEERDEQLWQFVFSSGIGGSPHQRIPIDGC